MIGTQVSHYIILEELGRGGMGVVYMAEDTKLGRVVALKFLPPDLISDAEAKQRFILEAQAASALQHNNICTIHDIGETDDGQLFIVMDYYQGETLKTKLDRERLTTAEIIEGAKQVAAGLKEAHDNGIVHRDIKPANIMITNKGVVKIMDFGLAKLAGKSDFVGKSSTLGTPRYMSPEQTRGEAVDQRADLWSVGVILYEALTGQPPFKGEYESSLIYSILNDEPAPVTSLCPDVPVELERITMKALAKAPEKRYQDAAELLADIRRIGKAAAVPQQRVRRFTPLLWGGVVVALCAALLWTFLQREHGDSEVVQKRKAIAVLPFQPITKSEEDRSFAEGIHADILTQVSKISDLKVIARTSVLRYQESQKSIKEIAHELGVGSVLEGSTRRSGNIIRVTAQLTDAGTEENLWAETYDRPYADIFAIQSDIAQKISTALQARLAQDELRAIQAPPTQNLKAYGFYKKGEHFWNISYSWDGNLKAAGMFAEATRLDSSFVLAYTWQSIAYSVVYLTTPQLASKSDYEQKSKAALLKATSLAPDLPEVHLARGIYWGYVKGDADAALKEAEVANLKRPNDTRVLSFMSDLYSSKRDLRSALEIAEKIYQLDPKGSWGPFYAGWHLFRLGRYAEAEKWADVMIANDPEGGAGYGAKIHFLLQGLGEVDRAEIALKEAGLMVTRDQDYVREAECFVHAYKRDYARALVALQGSPQQDFHLLRAMLFRLMNRPQEARANFDSARVAFAEAVRAAPNNKSARLSLAIAHAGLGEKAMALQEMVQLDSLAQIGQGLEIAYFHILNGDLDSAMLHLENCITNHQEPTPAALRLDPRLDALRSEPRFERLLARTEHPTKT